MNAAYDSRQYRRVGRTIGVLLLSHIVSAPLANFGLLEPVFAAPGFLVNAATHALQVSSAALILLAMGAVSIGIAIAALPLFRRYSPAPAIWLLALAVASFSLTAVESTTLLSLLSLSQAYAKAAVADSELFEAMRVVVASARNWAHYVGLIVAGSMVFTLYLALYRSALVPRILAAFGMGAALLQLVAVAMPLFGHRIVFPLLLPLGVIHLILSGWLMTRGFEERELKP